MENVNRFLLFFFFSNFFFTLVLNLKLGVLHKNNELIGVCQKAINLAKDEGNCVSDDISLLFRNSCVSESQVLGTMNAADLYFKDQINAFVGPLCSDEFHEIGRLSYFWKKPVFGRTMATKRMLDFEMFPNIVQMSLTTSAGLIKAVREVVNRLNIHQDIANVSIIGPEARDQDHYPLAQGMNDYLQTDSFLRIAFFGLYNERSSFPSEMRDIIYQNSSKVIIAGGDFEFGDTMKTMELDKLSGYGHVIIMVFAVPVSVFSDAMVRSVADNVDVVIAPLMDSYEKLLTAVGEAENSDKTRSAEATSLFLSCYGYCYGSKIGTKGDTQSYMNYFKGAELKTGYGTFQFDASASLLTDYGVYRGRAEYDGPKLLFKLKSQKMDSCSGASCFNLVREATPETDADLNFWNSLIVRQKELCAWTNQCNTHIGYYIGWACGCLLFVLLYIIYRWRKQSRINFFRMHWRIRRENLKIIENKASSVRNKGGIGEAVTLSSKRRQINSYALVGTVKAEFIAMRQFRKIRWSRQELKYVFELKQLNHDNITKFMGICCNELDSFYVLHALIERASLEDFIKDPTFVMDATFISAFIRDILKGLTYLHKSGIGNHGMLTSSNCLIDSNWVLKLSNFGVASMIHEFVKNGTLAVTEHVPFQFYSVFPPELLKDIEIGKNYPRGTVPGDIYCFGMILYQITYRNDPFEHSGLNPRDVITQIINKNIRPQVENVENDVLLTVMVQCWDVVPESRPKLRTIHQTVATAFASTQGHLVDQMLKMNERYAQNLEKIVEEKNAKIQEAQEKTIRLLNELLPKSIAEVLKAGGTVPPRNYDLATVLFVQVCDFQILVGKSGPEEVIGFLNDVYDTFDTIIRRHDAYKVETTGETYMVASGVPMENEGRHITEIAEISLEIREASYHYVVAHLPEFKVCVKIGFHCGPIAAGVIGIRSPRYCLFGDTVNFASRMQSNCPPNQIQTSEVTAMKLMEASKDYDLVKRGIVQVKGKGAVNCYWLNEHIGPEHEENDAAK